MGRGRILLVLIGVVLRGGVTSLADDCSDPNPVPNTYRRFSDSTNVNGSMLQYSCYMGFTLVAGDLVRQCSNGQYTGQPPLCKVDCGEPRTYEGSDRTGSNTTEGSVVHYTCLTNTTISTTGTCLSNGHWQYTDDFPCFGPLNLALNKPFQPNIPLVGLALDGDLATAAPMGPANVISISIDIGDNNIFYDLKNYVIKFYDQDEPNIGVIEFCLTGVMMIGGSPNTINGPCGRTEAEGGVARNFILDEPIPCCFLVNQVSIIAYMVNDTVGTFGVDEIEMYGRQRIVDCGNPEFVYGANVTLWRSDNLWFGKYECLDGFYLTSPFNSFFCHPGMYWQFPSDILITCSDEPLVPMSASLTELTDGYDATCEWVAANQIVVLESSALIEANNVIIRYEEGGGRGDISGIKVTLPYGRKCETLYKEAGIVEAYHCYYRLVYNLTITNTGSSDVSICEVRVSGRSHPISEKLECTRADEMYDYKGTISASVTGKPCRSWKDNVAPLIHSQFHSNYCRGFGNESRPWCYVGEGGEWEFCPVRQCHEFCSLREDGFRYLGDQDFSASGRSCRPWTQQDKDGNVFRELSFPYPVMNHNFCRNPGSSQSGPWCYLDGSVDESETCNIPQCPEGFQVQHLVNDTTVLTELYELSYFYDPVEEEMVQEYNFTVDYDFVQQYCLRESTHHFYAFKLNTSWQEIIISCVAEESSSATSIESSASTIDIVSPTISSSAPFTPGLTSFTPGNDMMSSTPSDELTSITPGYDLMSSTPGHELTSSTPGHQLTSLTPSHDMMSLTPGYDSTSSTTEEIQNSFSYFTDSFSTFLSTTPLSPTPFLDTSIPTSWISDSFTINKSFIAATPSSATPYLYSSMSDFFTMSKSCDLSSTLTTNNLMSSVTQTSFVNPSSKNCSCMCFPKTIYNVSDSFLQNRIENISRDLTVDTQVLSATIRKLTSAEDLRPSATYVGSAAIFIFSFSVALIVLPDMLNVIAFLRKCVISRRNKSLIL